MINTMILKKIMTGGETGLMVRKDLSKEVTFKLGLNEEVSHKMRWPWRKSVQANGSAQRLWGEVSWEWLGVHVCQECCLWGWNEWRDICRGNMALGFLGSCRQWRSQNRSLNSRWCPEKTLSRGRAWPDLHHKRSLWVL